MCFAVDKENRSSRALDEKLHANEYRVAARGNAFSFPLLWQDLRTQVHDGDTMEELGKGVSLPRTGAELTHVVLHVVQHR